MHSDVYRSSDTVYLHWIAFSRMCNWICIHIIFQCGLRHIFLLFVLSLFVFGGGEGDVKTDKQEQSILIVEHFHGFTLACI